MSGNATLGTGAPRASSYALQQLVRAFNANATSWIGLVTFLLVVALALLAPADLALRPARSGHPGAAPGALGGALVRHRFLRPRHPLPPVVGRAPVACHQHSLDPRRGADRGNHRHSRRLCRRPLRHGGHAGDGCAALVPVADHGADGGGDARRQHGQPHDRHRADGDCAVRAHCAGADDPGQGARAAALELLDQVKIPSAERALPISHISSRAACASA